MLKSSEEKMPLFAGNYGSKVFDFFPKKSKSTGLLKMAKKYNPKV